MGPANGYHSNTDKHLFIHIIPTTPLGGGGGDCRGGGITGSNGEGKPSSSLSCLWGLAGVDTCGLRACWQLAGVVVWCRPSTVVLVEWFPVLARLKSSSVSKVMVNKVSSSSEISLNARPPWVGRVLTGWGVVPGLLWATEGSCKESCKGDPPLTELPKSVGLCSLECKVKLEVRYSSSVRWLVLWPAWAVVGGALAGCTGDPLPAVAGLSLVWLSSPSCCCTSFLSSKSGEVCTSCSFTSCCPLPLSPGGTCLNTVATEVGVAVTWWWWQHIAPV